MPEAALLIDALAAAADEFLEEGYAYPVALQQLKHTAPEYLGEAIEKLLPHRTSADGLFVWFKHLVWLEGILDIQPQLELTASEVEGLKILRQARTRFLQSHPPCPHCGMPNERGTLTCRDCLKGIKN